MPTLSISQVAAIVGGQLLPEGCGSQTDISSISIDSRSIIDPGSSLFFALKGERDDGHRYVQGLVSSGVKSFVVSDYRGEFDKHEGCCFVVVPDSLVALQKLAEWNRSRFNGPVLAITGSNGKTIVKEWLSELLVNHAVVRSPKSYNSQVGVPLSVWNLNPNHGLAIFEAGMSKPGEMQNLARIIKPTIGILTNVGEAHQENFVSKRQKLDEKLLLFGTCQTLIYCCDQNLVRSAIAENQSLRSCRLISWSYTDSRATLCFTKSAFEGGTKISAAFEGRKYTVSLPFSDEASLENAGHCLAFVLSQHFDSEDVMSHFAHLQPVAMRLEIKEGINNSLLINDYYNSDINSLGIALGFLNNHARYPFVSKTVILSDIQQAGVPDGELYAEVARLLKLNKVDRLIGIGSRIGKHAALFDVPSSFFGSVGQFLNTVRPEDFKQECLLLKGAREFHFERISAAFQKKYHQTVLEIDLNAMIGNLNFYRSLIHPTTRVMVMVKAFSYGSGLAEIARALQFHKVDYLAVAVADEGIELRQAGIGLPIVVMNPETHSFDNIISFGLEPNIYSEEVFTSFRKSLRQHAVEGYPVHIKLDTGMNRLGFGTDAEVEQIADKLHSQSEMVVRSVFSHLAAADESALDGFTFEQVSRFSRLSSIIVNKLSYKVLLHVLNSAGIERFPQFQFDMVRLGIGLYGASAYSGPQVKNIGRLMTRVSQIKAVSASQTVGYGRKGVPGRDALIAILPIGYADGYDRRLSNGVGKVFVNGQFAPVIGNICMDMCMIDVTGLNVAVGDEVELMGEHVNVADIAETIGTIAYEILTGISQRVKRVYLQE